MKFTIKDFFSKCDQIRRKLQIWSHSQKKSLMESVIFICSDGLVNEEKFAIKRVTQHNC